MENQNQNSDNTTPPPANTSKKSSNVVLIVVAVIGGILLLGIILVVAGGYFAYSKISSVGGDAFNEAMKEMQKELDEAASDTEESSDEYDRFDQDDNDYVDEHGGRVYATKHGIPDEFPEAVIIVQPSELKQITSQARAKGETPIRWSVITESEYGTVAETKAAIEAAYDGFGGKVDRTDRPGAEIYAEEAVMLSYRNDDYAVNITATQETEYQAGPVGNFMIVYNIQVLGNNNN